MSNPTTIAKATGSADDSTGKWGTYIVSYGDSGWVVEQQNDQDGSLHSDPITPMGYTTSGLPIFGGGIESHGFGMYDYIVALSHTKFLIISGPESSDDSAMYNVTNDPTLLIAQSVAAL